MKDISELVSFSRNRPSAEIQIETIEADPKIAVVIPTPNARSQRARTAAEIFRPFTVLLVESSGRYFNYSRSLNRGFDSALKLNPDWVVLCNDDLYRVDPIQKLEKELLRANDADVVFAAPGYIGGVWFHTHNVFFYSKPNLEDSLRRALRSPRGYKFQIETERKFAVRVGLLAEEPVRLTSRYYLSIAYYRQMKTLHSIFNFLNFGDFCVFRSSLLRRFSFDETFINYGEDIDLAFRLKREGVPMRVSAFRIGSNVSSSLGTSRQRSARGMINSVFLSNKIGPLVL